MIPADIVAVTSFPLSRNNKIDVGALLKTLSIYKEAPAEADTLTAMEEVVQRLWQKLFNTEKIGINDDFFRIGGNSILAVRLVANIKNQFDIAFPMDAIFQFSTIRSLGARLDEIRMQTESEEEDLLMKINDRGSRTPLFLMPSVGGNSIEYAKLFEGMSDDQPFYGLLSKGVEGKSAPFETIEEAAGAYAGRIASMYPAGPVNIGGYSFGGTLAFELASLLETAGCTVNTLFILDKFSPLTESSGDDLPDDVPYDEWMMFFYKLYFKGHNIDEIRSPLKREDLLGLTPGDQLQLLYSVITMNGSDYTFQQLKGFTEVYRTNFLRCPTMPMRKR
jgi:acyl carrier protein